MPIIGNPLNSVAFLTDSFNGNGSTTAFTMSVAPATSSSILVNITGVTQAPSTYSVVGTTLTFSTAPPSGTANISVRYLGIPASGVTTTAYRTLTEFTATASQTTFTPPSYTVGFIAVYQNGVMLGSADYTATNGTTVVLAVGALVNDLITTESFYVSSVLNALPVTGGTISGNLVVTGTASITGITTLTGGLNTPLAVTSGGTGLTTVPHTVQTFTSGSGTYTTPANCKAIKVTMVGGGGGGGGSGATIASCAGGPGGSTTFGTSLLTCGGGYGGAYGGTAPPGGSATGGSAGGISINGGDGSNAGYTQPLSYVTGGTGGSSPLGGAGGGSWLGGTGSAGKNNTGGGGGGAGSSVVATSPNAGGGSGGYISTLITSPSATYSYAIGAGGTAGAASTNGYVGAVGGSGFILVEEFYV